MIKKIFTKKQVRSWKNYKKNVLQDRSIVGILNTRAEKREFYQEIRKNRSGGITKKEMRRILGGFEQGKGDHIDAKESRALAREYLGGSRYMLGSGNEEYRGSGYDRFRTSSSDNSITSSNSSRDSYLGGMSRFRGGSAGGHNN